MNPDSGLNDNKYRHNFIGEFCLPGFNAMKSCESESTFQRNISSPSSGSMIEQRKKLA
jgi:hypothetical protein